MKIVYANSCKHNSYITLKSKITLSDLAMGGVLKSIIIHTADVTHAGTDGNIYADIRSKTNLTIKQECKTNYLDNPDSWDFERNE